MDSLLPFLQGTCTPYNMPVYPGAPEMPVLRQLARGIADPTG